MVSETKIVGLVTFSVERRAKKLGSNELALTVSSKVKEITPLLRSKVKSSSSGGVISSMYSVIISASFSGIPVRLLLFISKTEASATDT